MPGSTATEATLPRLAGIIISSDGPAAIFQIDADGKRMVVRAGDAVAGWRVAAIHAEAVDLEKGVEHATVKPRFAPAGPRGPVATTPTTPQPKR